MSVRTMAAVWERSQHSGTHLLMLLAIADFADDDGRAYPSVPTLARKCRMKERNAQYILAELVETGELATQRGKGPRGSNVYRIKLASLGVQPSAPVQTFAPLQETAPKGCNGVRITPAMECTQTIIEPSMNRQGGFETFWSAYPKKKAKGDAQKAWAKIKANVELLSSILTALNVQALSEDWQKDGGKFIPYPATWLNGRRWEDEMPSEVCSAGGSLRDMPGVLK